MEVYLPAVRAAVMKHCLCLIASIFLVSCVAIPVPPERVVLDGKEFTDSELEFVRTGASTRSEVTFKLGNPTIWFPEQRILVYGLHRVESGALWFMGAGLSGAGGRVQGETKEAVYLVFDDNDVVTHWGRAQAKRCDTWLSAATRWTGSENLKTPPTHDRFVEATPTMEQGLIYFYRPRDFQHVLPLVPPAKKVMSGVAEYADISLNGNLVGQIRWQSYVVVRVPPGSHSFVIDPDTDCVANPDIYHNAIIQLDVAPGTVTFVDVGIQAGLGTIEPILVNRPRGEALSEIKNLRESW